MSYALNLSDDNRILSATFEQFAAPEQPLVDELPDGNLNDYLYVDGSYVYDPIPAPVIVPVAEKTVSAGEYFSVGETLYVALTKIPAGDPIKPGTNCKITTVESVLNALNA